MRTTGKPSQKQEFASQSHKVIFRGVEEATRREQEKNGGRRGPRLRVLKCSEASGRDDPERKKKWQIQIK